MQQQNVYAHACVLNYNCMCTYAQNSSYQQNKEVIMISENRCNLELPSFKVDGATRDITTDCRAAVGTVVQLS